MTPTTKVTLNPAGTFLERAKKELSGSEFSVEYIPADRTPTET